MQEQAGVLVDARLCMSGIVLRAGCSLGRQGKVRECAQERERERELMYLPKTGCVYVSVGVSVRGE